jgi:hypothetical protein
MCVDYTDLNKHCPRTPSGCRRLIKSLTPRRAATCSASSTATPGTTRSLSRKKTEETTFITLFGAYYYTTMSFRLKNTGATY